MNKPWRTISKKIISYRIHLLLSISFLALVLLLLIQIKWIQQARAMNEEQFNHRVGLALHESVDQFMKDRQHCEAMRKCMKKDKYDADDSAKLEHEVSRLDSIIKEQFQNYQIRAPYNIEVLTTADKQPRSKCFYYSLRKALSDDKAILNVYFSKIEHHLLDSMGSMFICSAILIGILFIFFGMTIYSLFKDRKILSRTTDLINNIAHEFKTPMSTIALASKMLGRDKVLDNKEQVKYYSKMINTENTRLRGQIDQLLKLTSLDRGELQLKSNQFHVHDLIDECAESLSVQIAERNGDLQIKKNTGNDIISGDRDLLQNVFFNLLDNAVKYSTDSPQILVESNNKNGYLHISVSDKGIGMTKEEQNHVFDRYYRAPTGDRHDVKGFGIGLSYSKLIVDAHKGSIQVMSRKHQGSTFTVILPLA